MDDQPVSSCRSSRMHVVLFAGFLIAAGFLGGYWVAAGKSPLDGEALAGTLQAGQPGSADSGIRAANTQVAVAVPTPLALKFLAPQEEFIRLQHDAAGKPTSLDVAVSTYRPKAGGDVSIALVGAVHVADRAYFDALNKELANYDAVLYELVAPKDTRPSPNPTASKDILSMVQYGLTDLLEVVHQLDEIDYHKSNFVHADLSMDELQKEGQARGETQFTLFASVALDAMRLAQKAESDAAKKAPALAPTPTPDLLSMLSDPNTLRAEFAKSLAQGDMKGGVPGFASLTPYLIDVRNQAAINVLNRELSGGKKKIAIFYGAAHLPDFEKRLNRDFGMQRVETRWLKAWDLSHTLPKKNPLAVVMKLLSNQP